MNRLLSLLMFFLIVLISCGKEDSEICEVCDSNKLITFKYIQRNLDTVLFDISYNNYGKPEHITQSGYVKNANRWINTFTQESIDFFMKMENFLKLYLPLVN